MKLKCASCKELPARGRFFETSKPTSKKRGCYTPREAFRYHCRRCTRDAVMLGKAKKLGREDILAKVEQYKRLIVIYKKALEVCND